MRFDESQSRGLKNHLIRELALQTAAAMDDLINKLDDSYVIAGSINRLKRMSDGLQSRLKKFLFLATLALLITKNFTHSVTSNPAPKENTTLGKKSACIRITSSCRKKNSSFWGVLTISVSMLLQESFRDVYSQRTLIPKEIFYMF